MQKKWQFALLAFFLAALSWYLVTGQERVESWFGMSIAMSNPPEGLIIHDGLPERVQIRVRGPKGLIRTIDSRDLSYSIDAEELVVGDNFVDLDPKDIPLSSAFEVVEIKPSRLHLKLDRYGSKNVEVVTGWKGKLHKDYKVDQAVADPSTVTLRGPETLLRKHTIIRVALSADYTDDVPPSVAEDVALVLPEGVEATPPVVRAEVTFTPKTKEIWVKVPLRVQAEQGRKYRVERDYVRLLLDGPVFLFRNNEFRKDISAVVDLTPFQDVGEVELEYHVSLPEGTRVVRRNPELIKAILLN